MEEKSEVSEGRHAGSARLMRVGSTASTQHWVACTYGVCTGSGGGGTPKADASTDKLRGCDSDKGGGGKKFEVFADVMCTGPFLPSFFPPRRV